jgi:hypothetical protein
LISKGRKIFTKEILEDLNIPNGPWNSNIIKINFYNLSLEIVYFFEVLVMRMLLLVNEL